VLDVYSVVLVGYLVGGMLEDAGGFIAKPRFHICRCPLQYAGTLTVPPMYKILPAMYPTVPVAYQ
jgi:hypothetical protein